ncbi:MAG: hypothetical protein ACP5FN_03795 [Candidatus Micrarchaeia archaeon]
MASVMRNTQNESTGDKHRKKQENWITYHIVNFVIEENLKIGDKSLNGAFNSAINRFLSPYVNIGELKNGIIEEHKKMIASIPKGYMAPYNMSNPEFYIPVNYAEIIAMKEANGFQELRSVLAKMSNWEINRLYMEIYSLKHPLIAKYMRKDR